ncbi:hypothetical protein [Peptococcus simiae]
MSGFLPDTQAKGRKQAARQQKRRQAARQQGKRTPSSGRQAGRHGSKPQPSDFAALSKKWEKKATSLNPFNPPKKDPVKKPPAPRQQVSGSPKKAKKEPIQAKKASISPHKTRLQSRYADRSINIQVENLDTQNHRGRQGEKRLDLHNVKEGVLWQAILEPPKAHQK